MKLILSMLCLPIIMMAEANEVYPHMPYKQYVDQVLTEAFDFLPMGDGMIELPNLMRQGSCKSVCGGSINTTLETLHVILSGMKSVTTNGNCITNSGKTTNVTHCQFSIPKASIRFVVNATDNDCSDEKYGLLHGCEMGYLHFSGSPSSTVTGNFTLTKILNSVKPSAISNFLLNPVKFTFVKPPEEDYSDFFKCIFQLLDSYGTGATFASPLEQQLPVFIQKVFNRDIY